MVSKGRVKQNYFTYCTLKTCHQRSNNNLRGRGVGWGRHHLSNNFTPVKGYRNFIQYKHENKSQKKKKRSQKLYLMNRKTSWQKLNKIPSLNENIWVPGLSGCGNCHPDQHESYNILEKHIYISNDNNNSHLAHI